MDTESSLLFITQKLANSIQAKKTSKLTKISGVQGAEIPSSRYITNLSLYLLTDNQSLLEVSAALVEKVTINLPTQPAAKLTDIPLLKSLQLADP